MYNLYNVEMTQCVHRSKVVMSTKICIKQRLSKSVLTNHSQEYSLSFSPRFANWNITQLLIG